MKAKDAIEILKQHPEANIEILVNGTFVLVDDIQIHEWTGGLPEMPNPPQFFVIPIVDGQPTTGSMVTMETLTVVPRAVTESDGNVIKITGREFEI